MNRNHRYSIHMEDLECRRMLSNYYVATTGLDTNPGSSASPFRTLQKAADMVRAGDVVTVRAGTYKGFVMGWDFLQDGTATSPILWKADPNVTINSRNLRTADGINIEGSDYVIIDGFRVINGDGTITRAGIRTVENTNVTIRNNYCDGLGYWGIFTAFANNVVIEGNTAINSVNQHGIYVSNSGDNPVVRDNLIYGNANCGLHVNGDISIGGDGIISNALIEGNIIRDNGNTGGSAINMDGVQNSMVRNNLLYNNHASGISLFQDTGGGPSRNNTIVNNTIIMASNGRWALNITTGSTNATVFNNVLFNNNTGRGGISISSNSLSGFVSDYNVTVDRYSNQDGNNVLTLAQWRTATGQDAHSVASTPSAVFANVAINDYHLSATSTAINRGIGTLNSKSAPLADLEGAARPAGGLWDAGAYERGAGAPDTIAPRVTGASHNYLTSPHRIAFTFDENVSGSLGISDLSVRNSAGATVRVLGYSYNTTTNTATFTVESPLADGNYTATLLAAGVTDAAGNRIGADYVFGFFVLAGDANHDRRVDIRDFSIIMANMNQTGRNFAQGDFNHDGVVNSIDMGILSRNWLKVV